MSLNEYFADTSAGELNLLSPMELYVLHFNFHARDILLDILSCLIVAADCVAALNAPDFPILSAAPPTALAASSALFPTTDENSVAFFAASVRLTSSIVPLTCG